MADCESVVVDGVSVVGRVVDVVVGRVVDVVVGRVVDVVDDVVDVVDDVVDVVDDVVDVVDVVVVTGGPPWQPVASLHDVPRAMCAAGSPGWQLLHASTVGFIGGPLVVWQWVQLVLL